MDEEFKELLQENLAKNEQIYQISLKLKHYLLISQILSIIRLLIIVVPIILAIIYLPSLLSSVFSQYQDLMQPGNLLPTEDLF